MNTEVERWDALIRHCTVPNVVLEELRSWAA